MPKPYLNKEKVDEIIRQTKKMIPLPRNAYLKTQTPMGKVYIDYILRSHNMSNVNRNRLAALSDVYFHSLSLAYNSKKKENNMFLRSIPNWTLGPYGTIQHNRRNQNNSMKRRSYRNMMKYRHNIGKSKANHLNYALTKYFRETNIRVPNRPTVFKNIKYLYRTIDEDNIPGDMIRFDKGTKIIRDKGYMSFSRDFEFAQTWGEIFSSTPVIFRLHVNDIPKGVPWLWFSSTYNSDKKTKITNHQKGVYQSLINNDNKNYNQYEVVLPPGYIILNHNQPQNINGQNLFDVRYVPDIHTENMMWKAPMHSKFTFNDNTISDHNRISRIFNNTSKRRRNEPLKNISKTKKKLENSPVSKK